MCRRSSRHKNSSGNNTKSVLALVALRFQWEKTHNRNHTCSVTYNASGGDKSDVERVKWKRAEEGLGWGHCSWCRVVRAAACTPFHCVHLPYTCSLWRLPEKNILLVTD